LTSVTNNTAEKIEYGYNLNGDMTSSNVKSPANVITKQMSMAYDELGRLMQSIGAATQTTTLSYDRTDLQVRTKDPRNNLYGYSLDRRLGVVLAPIEVPDKGEPPMAKDQEKHARPTRAAKITSLLMRHSGATLAEMAKS
jgi:YD repeat-containing protein